MLDGSEAFCCKTMDVMYVEVLVSFGSKSEFLSWNIHGTKFLFNSVSYVRSIALLTILLVHVLLDD